MKYYFQRQNHISVLRAATANWKGGPGKNIEIDILQENRNKDIKKEIRRIGANKTDKAIDRASRAAGDNGK